MFKAYPYIDMSRYMRISYHFSGDRYEMYSTENGEFVCQGAAMCACCEKIFLPAEGFWTEEDEPESLDVEGIMGICSRECALLLINDPETDDFCLLDDYGDEIREKLREDSGEEAVAVEEELIEVEEDDEEDDFE